jgi:hypothetical protein
MTSPPFFDRNCSIENVLDDPILIRLGINDDLPEDNGDDGYATVYITLEPLVAATTDAATTRAKEQPGVATGTEQQGKANDTGSPPKTRYAENPFLYAGCVFGGLLIIFFIAAYKSREINHGRWQILRFLGALCAGFCGGLFTGTALFTLNEKFSGSDLGISGTVGFAAFFTIWFTWGKPPIKNEEFKYVLEENVTFENAALSLAATQFVTLKFEGFAKPTRNIKFRAQTFLADTLEQGLDKLQYLQSDKTIPTYKVKIENSRLYTLIADQGEIEQERGN